MDEATDSPKRDLEGTPPSPSMALNATPWLAMEKNKRGHFKALAQQSGHQYRELDGGARPVAPVSNQSRPTSGLSRLRCPDWPVSL
ncbi:hypothetical protein HPB47_005518 [Ixodes persulcatus]|uniref:Uncharacterized protein n=1 Tax=Ixodes persulcatus TaxID=34615 RepID=A0AC60PDP7_IXOPE|nr:hypothetical protein HPB47_005518 [Ixodes persulcatus]